MSETTEIQPLRIGPFIFAMICGPLLFTLCTFWIYLIPLYAFMFGGIPYLVIGFPLAIALARTGPVTTDRAIAWAGFTILIPTAIAIVPIALIEGRDSVQFTLAFSAASLVFGVGWSASSAWIYGALTKVTRQQPPKTQR